MRTRLALTLALLAAGGCSTAGTTFPFFPGGEPYVVTAIDYHFHDAHPSRPISLGRPLQFSNQGRNPHNVTIPGTDVDRTIRPGARITFDPIGNLFDEPGRYPFVCKLHADRGMSGVLVVTD